VKSGCISLWDLTAII